MLDLLMLDMHPYKAKYKFLYHTYIFFFLKKLNILNYDCPQKK